MGRQGFSLVELSIVLVILGLLTGGILSGQSLIRAAELRTVSTDFNKYLTAAHTFRDKYRALPGDMPNAVKFWGAQAGDTTDGTDATCAGLTFANPATGTATCNGNGNGQISNNTMHSSTNPGWSEVWRAWQHLANAGLVEGSYTGVPATSNFVDGQAGLNMPVSRVDRSGGYAFLWIGVPSSTGVSYYFPGSYGNTLAYGGGDRVDQAGLLWAEEAWNIDTKIDDGKPGQGKMRPYMNSMRPQCSTSNDPAVSEYRVHNATIKNCNLFLMTGF